MNEVMQFLTVIATSLIPLTFVAGVYGEAGVTPLGIGGFCAPGALARNNADPERACRPFDSGRDGLVFSEGAGGDIAAAKELSTREFTALTTNNTLLNKAVQNGIGEGDPRTGFTTNSYPRLPGSRVRPIRRSRPNAVLEIAFVLNAVHGLKLVSTFAADVSVELHTDLSWDAEASDQCGKRDAAICPDRCIVKVPLTPEGLFAARRLGADHKLGAGKNVGAKATLAPGIDADKAASRRCGASLPRSGPQCAASAAKTRVAQQFAATVPCQRGQHRQDRSGTGGPSNKAAGALSLGASAPNCNR